MSKKNQKDFSWLHLTRLKVYLLILFLVIIFLFLFRGVLVEYNIDIFNLRASKEMQRDFKLEDRCSIIAGQLIHTISSFDECALKCNSACYSIESTILNSTFNRVNASCNSCECFCK